MSDCSKISALLELYVENRLSGIEKDLVEEHLASCQECRDKYVRMKDAIKNLRSSYEHMLQEFEEIERNKIFKIKEHEIFYANISSYIDNELSYNEAVDFRKYLLKSKPARKSLEEAYSLENTLKTTFNNYSDNLKLNYAKQITKMIKSERKEPKDMIFKRMMITLGVLLFFMTAFFLYITTAYDKQVSENVQIETEEIVPDIPPETWEEQPVSPENSEEISEETEETLAEVQ